MTPLLVYSCVVGSTLKTLLYCLIYILINHLISLSFHKRFIDNALSKASLLISRPTSLVSAAAVLMSVAAREWVCVHACTFVRVSQLIYLLQSPPSLVQRAIIYAVAVAILRCMLKWHHSSALTPACSLPADSSTLGMIYQALEPQTKAPRSACRARDGLIDKHCDSRTKHKRGSTS